MHILAFWLETAYSRPLVRGFWQHISPKWLRLSFWPQKTLPCTETRRLSDQAWKCYYYY